MKRIGYVWKRNVEGVDDDQGRLNGCVWLLYEHIGGLDGDIWWMDGHFWWLDGCVC